METQWCMVLATAEFRRVKGESDMSHGQCNAGEGHVHDGHRDIV